MKLRICICLFVTSALLAGAAILYPFGENEDRSSHSIGNDAVSVSGNGFSDESDSHGNDTEWTYPEWPVSEAFYYVTLQNNEVIAYSGDHRKICLQTRIDREELEDALIHQLQQGLYMQNLPELYEYLENCSS